MKIDRIAEPWGTRTPYAPGQTWPIRVDQFLADGIAEADVDRWVQSASILTPTAARWTSASRTAGSSASAAGRWTGSTAAGSAQGPARLGGQPQPGPADPPAGPRRTAAGREPTGTRRWT